MCVCVCVCVLVSALKSHGQKLQGRFACSRFRVSAFGVLGSCGFSGLVVWGGLGIEGSRFRHWDLSRVLGSRFAGLRIWVILWFVVPWPGVGSICIATSFFKPDVYPALTTLCTRSAAVVSAGVLPDL